MNPSISVCSSLQRIRSPFLGVIVAVMLFSDLLTPMALGQRRRLEVDLLSQSEIRQDIGLSEQESAQIGEILKSSTPDSDFFKPYLEKLKEAGDDKELQNSIRKEMFAKREEMTQQGKAKAIDALSAEQKAKLRGLFLESAGMRAFTDDRVAKEYGVDEDQVKKIAEIESARRTAERAMEDDASDEDWDKFDSEWNGKFLAVLNEKQQLLYKAQSLAKVAAPTAVAGGDAGSGGASTAGAMQQPAADAVGSFGSATKGDSKLVESFSFNFRNEMWERVLQMYADGTGLTLDLNQVPPGTFSHYDDNSYSAKKTLDILNGYLNRKGYVMIEKDGFLSVMNTDNGIPPYLIRDVTDEELIKVGQELEVGDNELANYKIDVDGMDAAKVAQEIEAVLGPLGSMVALTESKVLILTDVGSNLRRIRGFLMDAKSKTKPDALIFKSYFLTNMDVEEAEIQVMTQFGMRQNVQNVSAVNDFNSRSRSRTGAPQQQQTRPTPTSTSAATGPAVQIASDLRLNSLLVTGTSAQHELVETILTALDVSEGPGGEKLTRGRKGTYLEVYQVKNSDAGEVTKTLTAMNIPGVTVVNEDGRNGRIHIMATERQHEEVAMLVRQLDGSGSTGSVAVIPLTKMDPLSAAATLRSLFYADGDDAPTIETDLYGRRLIIRGDIEAITQIRAVLADLGEDGTGIRPRGNGDLVRRFSLQGRNPEQFLQVLQQQWESQQGTTINIVIPGEDSPIRSRRTPAEEFGSDTKETTGQPQQGNGNWDPSKPKSSGDDISEWGWKPANGSVVSSWKTAAVQEKNAAANSRTSAASEQTKDTKSDVIVQLMGDELLLVADDPSQLDELEELLDMLQQSLPMKAEWTVVYLELADATEAADMLSQFFPSSSVSSPVGATGGSMLGSLGASLGGMGSNLLDATGLSGLGMTSATLRIIPDIRTNSLFMTGPQSMINDALSFLQVLDSNDVPNSLKDMQPRQIPVKYADVDAVAGLVRDVFKPYLEAPPQQKGQQANPLAMMFGGGAGGAAGQASGIRMTLGVDNNTSILTVNSNQEIYEEVESVVLQMDEAAKAAKPTVRSVVLQNTDAAMVQTMLQSLMPRVSVGSSRTSGGSSSSTSGGGDSKAQEAAAQEVQNQIRQRMMQQFQGGGAGRGGGGGASPFGGRGGATGGRGGAAGGRGGRGGR